MSYAEDLFAIAKQMSKDGYNATGKAQICEVTGMDYSDVFAFDRGMRQRTTEFKPGPTPGNLFYMQTSFRPSEPFKSGWMVKVWV